MGEDIYGKGLRLVEDARVIVTDVTPRATYFEVRGDSGVHHVRLMRDNTFNCTCMWGTLKGAPYGSLCSHVVAAVMRRAHDPAPSRSRREPAVSA